MTSTTTSIATAGLGRSDLGLSVRWATWARRHPRPATAGWVLLLVASLTIGGWSEVRLASPHASGHEAGVPASATAATPTRAATGTVVFSGHGKLGSATVAAVRSDLAISLSRVPGVDAVGAPVLSADGSSAVVTVELDSVDAAAVQEVVRRVRARHPGLEISITGSTITDAVTPAA